MSDEADKPAQKLRVKEDPPPIPSREELAELALEIAGKALTHKRVYTNKRGDENIIDQPDFTAALKALELVGNLGGYLGKNQPAANSASGQAPASAEKAIATLRSRLKVAK